jgi:hypothetical protein
MAAKSARSFPDRPVFAGHPCLQLIHFLVAFFGDVGRQQRLNPQGRNPRIVGQEDDLLVVCRVGLGVSGHEVRQRFVRGLERFAGRAERQLVGFEIGVLNRQGEEIAVDALKIDEGFRKLGQEVLFPRTAARVQQAAQLRASLLQGRRGGARIVGKRLRFLVGRGHDGAVSASDAVARAVRMRFTISTFRSFKASRAAGD